MKKLKLLPSILMLVACVAILGVGVFAVAPTQNTITGSITINASNNPITIKVYENDTSGTLLVQAEARAGATLQVGALSFTTTNANQISEVTPIKLAVVFSTTSSENLVIDTETIESLNGTNSTGTVEDIVSVTKLHSYTATDTTTGLACFTSGSDYTITCTFRLAEFVNETTTVDFNMAFDVYKASDYEGDGINGVDYLYFGSFPQSEATTTTGLTNTGRTFEAYDDATGGVKYKEIYSDNAGNEYVKVTNVWVLEDDGSFEETEETKYFKIEPLKWNILTQEDGTALLVCDNIVEQVAFQNEYYTDSAKEYHTETRYYVKGEDGLPMLNTDTVEENDYIYANNYKYSDLRAYLNNTFYNAAFNNLQKQLIPLTELNNKTGEQEKIDFDISTNEYAEATANTTDYVFALSYDDYVNTEYGFKPLLANGENVNDDETTGYWFDTARMKQNTGYSTATGANTMSKFETFEEFTNYCCCGESTLEEFLACCGNVTTVDTEEEFLEHVRTSGWWWSRSAYNYYSNFARGVYSGGFANRRDSVLDTYAGCVPALRLSLQG